MEEGGGEIGEEGGGEVWERGGGGMGVTLCLEQ